MTHHCSASRRQLILGTTGAFAATALVGTGGAGNASASTADPYHPSYGDSRWRVSHYDIGNTVITRGSSPALLYGATTMSAYANQALTYIDIDFALNVTGAQVNNRAVKVTRLSWRKVRLTGVSVAARTNFTIRMGYSDYPATKLVGTDGILTATNTIAFVGEPTSSVYWFPANDRIDNKATYTISVSTQRSNQVLGPGNVMARTNFTSSSGTPMTNVRFVLNEPSCTYHPTVQVGSGISVQRGTWNIGGKNVTYHLAGSGSVPATLAQHTKQSLTYFSALYGPYPYSHVGAVALSAPWGNWGQENVGSVTYRRDKLTSNIAQTLIAHENAHTWFGNSVTCASWKDVVLIQEGLATLLEQDYGNRYGYYSPYQATPSTLAANPGSGGIANTAAYNSAVGVMRELRRTMDGTTDQAHAPKFTQFLRSLTATYPHQNVTRPQFKSLAAEAAGKDLSAFWSRYAI